MDGLTFRVENDDDYWGDDEGTSETQMRKLYA